MKGQEAKNDEILAIVAVLVRTKPVVAAVVVVSQSQ